MAHQAGIRHGAVGSGDTISLGRPSGPLHPHPHLHLYRQAFMLHSINLQLTARSSALS